MNATVRNLGDTLYFGFASNDTAGSGADGSNPAAVVRRCGAAASAAPVYTATPTLLTHDSYPPGSYEVAIPATSGNGFEANKWYSVYCTLAVDGENPTGYLGSFYLTAAGETPLTNSIIANYINNVLTTLHGAGTWGGAMGAGVNPVTISLRDDSNDPVPGVLAVARNDSESTIVAIGLTNADGKVELQLDNGTYKVRFGPGYAAGGPYPRALGGGYGFDNPYTITVDGTTSTTLSCTSYSTVVGGLTFGEMKAMLRNAIRRNYREDIARFLLAGESVAKWINSAYQELDRKLRWSRAHVDLSTSEGREEYALGSTVREIDLVEYIDVSEDNQPSLLQELSLEEWVARRHAARANGTPTNWCRNGDAFYLYPPPDTEGDTVRIWAIMEPSDLVGDEEKPPFMAHLHQLIVDLAMCHVARHMGEFQVAAQTRAYIESELAKERLEPAVKRTGPDRIQHSSSVL